ncbi:Odorant-binding protein 93a [Drosophila ananassae]|uniref:Odorant-binding protein 93a n=1 Tax=Drosophila ananassae TaxID=7217 RepID=B3M2V5_DROAN|nr:general odorant-binding protein 68 [Drosophila ananassae]EDV43485.1 Odorant-binding protein 93a [Drosophila ananassae]
MYHRFALFCILLFYFFISVLSFNYTNCDQAKHPKFISSCCNVQKNNKTIKECRKSLLANNSTSTKSGSANLRSDKVALNACIAECSFKANGFLLNNGTVNVTALQKSYQQRYKNDPATSKLMVKSVAQCAKYAQEQVQQSEWMHTKGDCNYYPATLLACIMEQVYVNCPTTKWKNTDDCAAMRKYLMDCDDVERKK